ncbi:hypothetical protein ACQJBY_059253 [Aegilops geniculata]
MLRHCTPSPSRMSSWSASKGPTASAIGIAIRSGGRGRRHEERQPRTCIIDCDKQVVAGLRDSLPISWQSKPAIVSIRVGAWHGQILPDLGQPMDMLYALISQSNRQYMSANGPEKSHSIRKKLRKIWWFCVTRQFRGDYPICNDRWW